MNNQTAQTMPALVDRVRECHAAWAACNAVAPGEDRALGTEKLLTEVLAALSQTAGVADAVIKLSTDLLSQCTHADALGELPDQIKGETMFLLAQSLAAAPAASGGEHFPGGDIGVGSPEQTEQYRRENPPAAASVSERGE